MDAHSISHAASPPLFNDVLAILQGLDGIASLDATELGEVQRDPASEVDPPRPCKMPHSYQII